MTKQDLVVTFKKQFDYPRTWSSLRTKAEALNLGGSMESLSTKSEVLQENPEESLLFILTRSKRPLKAETLCEMLEERTAQSISVIQLRNLVKRLRGHSYDIKGVASRGSVNYVMVRTADISSDTYYKSQGNIGSAIALTSDFHIGSKTFSKKAYDLLVADIIENSVSDVMIDGDLIQSLGVHRLELADIDIWDASEQVIELVGHLCEIPKDVNIHFVMGNHEEKLKNRIQVGYDALLDAVSKMNERGYHNCNYYGSVANLTMDDEYRYLMMHTAGGVTYSTSYRTERTFDKLIQKPHIFHTGHSHQLMHLAKAPHHELFISGTLQRENAWLMNKGLTSMVGWYIMRGYSPERCRFERVSPRVF